MGLFLTLSSVINKSENEVETALRNYLKTVKGGLEREDIDNTHKNFCVIQQGNGNTTIVYPPYFLKWDNCANSLSSELSAPVFVLHIYDGDFWSYTLFVNGEIKDQFMPIPDYFDENANQEEIKSWKGNAAIIATYVPGLLKENIEKYLVRWDMDQDEAKAYEGDEFTNCEYQLFDFMRKLKLPYQIDSNDIPIGNVFKFWSTDIPLTDPSDINKPLKGKSKNRAWWKFW